MIAGTVLSAALLSQGMALAHGGGPKGTMSMPSGRVIDVMERDFLVPRGFRWLPGPMFYLAHAKELGLTGRQRMQVLAIAHEIMPNTLREGKEIERMKRTIRSLSDGRRPPDLPRLRALLLELGKKEARANYEHLAAHEACLDPLTPLQRTDLFSLLGKS